jgi:hypothetical protein
VPWLDAYRRQNGESRDGASTSCKISNVAIAALSAGKV